MKNPLISVVVPVYNVSDYLDTTINSLINQSFDDYEIVLVNDGSTDDSGKKCDYYAKKYDYIKVIHKKNGGIISARICGAQNSLGKYIYSMDGDDWVDKDKLQKFVDVINKQEPDLIYTAGYIKQYDGFEETHESDLPEGLYIGDEILSLLSKQTEESEFFFVNDIMLSRSWQLCVRRDLYLESILKVPSNVSLGEENISFIHFLTNSKRMYVLRDFGYHYVKRNGSISEITTDAYREKFKKWYSSMDELFLQGKLNKYRNEFIGCAFFHMMSFFYSDLRIDKLDYLFPYYQVKKGSKVVIYGAGKFGKELIKYLSDKQAEYPIVLCVDKEFGGDVYGHKIADISAIKDVSYDYVIIAIMWYSVARKIGNELVKNGVDKEKIAYMCNKAIDSQKLPSWLDNESEGD